MKGLLQMFSPGEETLLFTPDDASHKRGKKRSSRPHKVALSSLKAIYYVKSFEGDASHREKRVFGLMEGRGKRVMVKFKDGEVVTGFADDNLPWQKGFFLEPPHPSWKGFFLHPSDPRSNNLKIFVVISSLEEAQKL